MRDVLYDARVPEEDIIVERRGKKVTQKQKMYPGYVLADIDLPEDEMEWKRVYAEVRSIVGVGMFLTSGGGNRKPVPLSFDEVRSTFEQTGDIEGGYTAPEQIWNLGEKVRVNEGPFKDFEGVVQQINVEKESLTVSVEIFGRLTPVELEYRQVRRS